MRVRVFGVAVGRIASKGLSGLAGRFQFRACLNINISDREESSVREGRRRRVPYFTHRSLFFGIHCIIDFG